jgi:3-deoxy-D-manno-octulosonate 8-phosphate phosphatase (KDO 8-P phosphatase)
MMKTTAEKARPIRLVISDVDGVLTTGALFYQADGTELKVFNVQDGLGIKMLQQTGVNVAIITARTSEAVAQRMRDLKVEHVYQGQANKLPAYEELKQKLHLTDQEIAYIGDDLPDLPLLRRVGFSVTVPNAPQIIQEHAAWITCAEGGKGAVRELCELIMQAQGTYQPVIDSYLQR